MMHKTFVSLLLICSAAAMAAGEVKHNQALIANKVDSLESKRGVQIGGSIRASYLGSYLNYGQDVVDSSSGMQETERTEFVSVDLDFHFRPWEFVRANVMIRMEAGMQDYFSAASKSLSAGWMNVEGNIGNDFYWVVGDFRQQYSPLTLYAPDVEIMYEPQIFARERLMAKTEAQLLGNARNLQGANLQYRHNAGDMLGEIRAEALLARLRRVQVLDFSGANGNILPNEGISGASQAANMDKWLVGGNLEWLPLDRNLMAGLTALYIFDDESSFNYTTRHAVYGEEGLSSEYVLQAVNPYDTTAQNTFVMAARLGGDVSSILNNKNLILDVTAEYAHSMDKVFDQIEVSPEDNSVSVTSRDLNGNALLATVNAGYQSGEAWKTLLIANVIYNDSNWFNNVAQSPQFFAQRILNTDRDGTVSKYGVNAPLYSTFGALYHFTPKFSPSATTRKTDDAGFAGGQTSSYNIAPYTKNSWTSLTYTRSELALINAMSDPAVQLALPNGFATSNRMGVNANLKFNVKNFAEAQGLFNYFEQVKAEELLGFDKAKYMEYGAGAKLDIFKLIGFSLPLEISGSYKHSNKTMGVLGAGDGELDCDFINAGLYWQYLPRLGFSAGLQYVNMEMNDIAAVTRTSPGYEVPLMKGKQMQWMVGLDYTLADNAWFSLNYGMISVENTYNVTGGTGANLNYAQVEEGIGSYKYSFDQSIVEATINVEF